MTTSKMPFRRRMPRLPSEVIPPSDERYIAAKMGDEVVTDACRWRKFSFLIAVTVYLSAVNIGTPLVGSWEAFCFAIIPAGIALVTLRTRFKPPPWDLDYRPPILVLRSHTDERIKLGDRLPAIDHDPSPPERNPFIWQMHLDLWDWSRVVILMGENPRSTLELKAVVVETSDMKWHQKVIEIGTGSWIILVFPSSTDGCVEELNLLAGNLNLLCKTVVFMPPTPAGLDVVFSKDNSRHQEVWDQVAKELCDKGFHLPNYDSRGMFYRPNRDFSIKKEITLNHREGPWSLIAKLVPHPEVGGSDLRSVIGEANAYEAHY